MYQSRLLYFPDSEGNQTYSPLHKQQHLFGGPITDIGIFGQEIREQQPEDLEEISDKHTLPLFGEYTEKHLFD